MALSRIGDKTWLSLMTVMGCLGIACAAGCLKDGFNLVDLSHTLDSNAIRFPGDPNFILTILYRGVQPVGLPPWLELNKFETVEHIGTHMDSPAHFSQGSWRVHQIPAERFVGPGVIVDIRRKVLNNPDYRLGVSDLVQWESLHGTIPKGAFVFMWSGWDVRYPDPYRTFNTATPDDSSTFHFPGFHPDAVNWLLENRNISMIGVDTPSVDYGQTEVYDVHQIVGKANVMGLENVNNLGQVPASGATIIASPVKLLDGSGAPIRILALVSGSKELSNLCPECSIYS